MRLDCIYSYSNLPKTEGDMFQTFPIHSLCQGFSGIVIRALIGWNAKNIALDCYYWHYVILPYTLILKVVYGGIDAVCNISIS